MKRAIAYWVIAGWVGEDPKYWSTEIGWTDFDTATPYTDETMRNFIRLPIGGAWCAVPYTFLEARRTR